MKRYYPLPLIFLSTILSCTEQSKKEPETSDAINLKGTWKLLTGTLIEKGDTVVTDYTKDRSFIKIINDSHFAFLGHTLRKDTTDFSAEAVAILLCETSTLNSSDIAVQKNGKDMILVLP